MKVIGKFKLEVVEEQEVEMPYGARILTVQAQNNIPCIWAICDTTAKVEKRKFRIYGTGHTHENIGGEYIGTFQKDFGYFVFHVFEG